MAEIKIKASEIENAIHSISVKSHSQRSKSKFRQARAYIKVLMTWVTGVKLMSP